MENLKLYFRVLFSWILIFTAFRVALSIWSRASVFNNPEWYWAFIYGIRFDLIVFCFSISWLFIFWSLSGKVFKPLFRYMIIFMFLLAAFNEVGTFNYFSEYGSRLDRQVFEFANRPQEVLGMLLKAYYWHFIAAVFIIYVLTKLLSARLLPVALAPQPRRFSFYGSLFFILVFSVIGARSSFGHRPANISTASFSSEFWLNQLGLNSTYTLVYALMRSKDEKSPMSIYPSVDIKTLMWRYREQGAIEGKVFDSPKIENVFYKTAHKKSSSKKIENVVWILEESFGAEYTGSVGHLKLTPNFDKWSMKGALFTQLYATGTRTSRGLEALLASLPPTPSFSVVKLAKANRDFFTMATLLKEKGFQTVFMYPGDSNFDDMKAFFLGNGFEKVYDQKDLSKGLQHGVWGVHDDDLLVKAHAFLKDQNKPTFLVVLTTSNHTPYDYDESRIRLDPRFAKASPENAIHYADYAIGLFFDLASRETYFDKSLFMVVADHNTRVYGEKYFPVHKFHIPGFIIAPGLKPQKYEKLMSQIDLPPTILGLMNISDVKVPFIGRDIFNTSLPGRAMMQYGDEHLYFEEDKRALLLRPHLPAQMFSLIHNKWSPLTFDENFFLNGYKYPSLAWYLYDKELLKKNHRSKSSLSQN